MSKCILEKKFLINNRNINCKVLGDPMSINEDSIYVLEINGGPGQNMNTRIYKYLQNYSNDIDNMIWIIFDNLGCGESDIAQFPDQEYTPENFTNIAVSVVECIFNELELTHMNLKIEGGSFGGTIALNIPSHRPQWTNIDSPIHLQSIFAFIAPIGLKDCMDIEFTREIYANNPNLSSYVNAINKLYDGTITTRDQYITEILVPLSPTYGDSYNSLLMKSCLSIIKLYPNSFRYPLNSLKNINYCHAFAEKAYDFLYNFSFDVTCYIFKNKWNNFELEEKFTDNPELVNVYNKIAIFAVYGKIDLCTGGDKTLIRLAKLLPNLGYYLHSGKHHDNYDKVLPLMINFLTGDIIKFCKSCIDMKIIDNCKISRSFVDSYNYSAKSVRNKQTDTEHNC